MTRFPLRVLVIAVLLPFAIAVSGIALQLAWLPDLPATVATHWASTDAPTPSARPGPRPCCSVSSGRWGSQRSSECCSPRR